ncbi:hypothetical protein M404DRAFT_996733 [Pisolithus tinctorius Marx 270]|uniref:Uncharacterized protein n=1 Tax=Pisolithus tinctorius Marx 270 TaxID=870435 RepID=A0A0C3P6Q6_PISTI|nr:hypothetical protein M404DRAFT_996733 [Pisolithus tinctorius Marx 270]
MPTHCPSSPIGRRGAARRETCTHRSPMRQSTPLDSMRVGQAKVRTLARPINGIMISKNLLAQNGLQTNHIQQVLHYLAANTVSSST